MSNNEDRALYSIGITNDNCIELSVGYPSSISLNMSPTAARTMIKLLQAAADALDDNREAANG